MTVPEIYYDVGFFLVPAAHLDELYQLEREAKHALDEMHDDKFYRRARIFLRAREVATASVVLEHRPGLSLLSHLRVWLATQFAGGLPTRGVFGPAEIEAMRAYTENDGFPVFARTIKAQARGRGKVDPAELRAYYEAFERVVQAAPPGAHGLVVCHFNKENAEPPPPPEPPLDLPPMAPEDHAKLTAHFERISRGPLRRQMPGWANMQFEGRMLLGCLSAEHGPRWRDAFLAHQDDAFADHKRGYAAYYAAMRRYADTIEHDLEDGVVETRAGLVYAIREIKIAMGWAGHVNGHPLATPEEVRTGWPMLEALEAEHGGADGLARWLLRKQRGWKLAVPRAAVARVREQLGRAKERGAWFVWLHDIYDWPGEDQVPEDFDWDAEGW